MTKEFMSTKPDAAQLVINIAPDVDLALRAACRWNLADVLELAVSALAAERATEHAINAALAAPDAVREQLVTTLVETAKLLRPFAANGVIGINNARAALAKIDAAILAAGAA